MHTPELIDRRAQKAESKGVLRNARVRPYRFYALYLILVILFDFAATVTENSSIGSSSAASFASPLGVFATVLSSLLVLILGAGCYLYCFGIRGNRKMEYPILFDGFSFAGKIILLYLAEFAFTVLWSFLLIVPGFIALYSYRFAVMNLCENPSMSVMEALKMSKRQTYGYKGQIFMLDLSYLGWYLLANLPIIYFNYATVISRTGLTLPGSSVSVFIQILIADVFFLLFSVMYLPHYQVTEIGYFEIAKRTSGIGAGVTPGNFNEDDSF